MIYLRSVPTETLNRDLVIHIVMDYETLPEDKQELLLTLENYRFVAEIPKSDVSKTNMISDLYVNPISDELWYEYREIPKTPEQLLEERLSASEEAILGLMDMLSM